MIDSPEIVQEWMDALHKNQSTAKYGRLDVDGKWREHQGNIGSNASNE